MSNPEFPIFKKLELKDREIIQNKIWDYQPRSSEWTFTNLYIWRGYYRTQWSLLNDWLLVLCNPPGKGCYFLQPIGPSSRKDVIYQMLFWLRDEKSERKPRIERADEVLLLELKGASDLILEPNRDHFDYIYRTRDLIGLKGRKYHSKKNRLNKFFKQYTFEYHPMTQKWIKECGRVLIRWCAWRDCEKYRIMRAEFEAVHEILLDYKQLSVQGGVITIDNQVEAFAIGEILNEQTAVIHVEKADPKIPELFTVINQQFCEKQWQPVPLLNREQDMGEPGLRRAKMSYQPHDLIKKFTIRLISKF